MLLVHSQLSSISECSDAAHGLGGHVLIDGYNKYPGDISKAFGAGDDYVMLGGMFVGHKESGESLSQMMMGFNIKIFMECLRQKLNKLIMVI